MKIRGYSKYGVKNRRIAVLLVAGIIFIIAAISIFAESSSQSSVMDGKIVYNETQAKDYTTISQALAEAGEGDVIRIANQTFNEAIIIDKSVSIIGESTTGSVLQPPAGKQAVTLPVSANGKKVFLENLTIINTDKSTGRGIQVQDDTLPQLLSLKNVNMNVYYRGISFNGNSISTAPKLSGMKLILDSSVIRNTAITDYDKQAGIVNNSRGISLFDIKNSHVSVINSEISGFAYGINVGGAKDSNSVIDTADLIVDVKQSTMRNWGCLNIWGSLATYNIENSILKGINSQTGLTNAFSTIVFNDDIYDQFGQMHSVNNILNIKDSTVTNYQANECEQELLRVDCGLSEVNLSGEVTFEDTSGAIPNAIYLGNMDQDKKKSFLNENVHVGDAKIVLKAAPGSNLSFCPVACIGDAVYTTVGNAVYAMKDGDTIELMFDTAEDISVAKDNFKLVGNQKAKFTGKLDVTGLNPTIQNIIFDGATSTGGTAYQNGGSLITVTSDGTLVFTGNTIQNLKGYAYQYLLANCKGVVTIEGNTFADSVAQGGGYYAYNGIELAKNADYPLASGSRIENNTFSQKNCGNNAIRIFTLTENAQYQILKNTFAFSQTAIALENSTNVQSGFAFTENRYLSTSSSESYKYAGLVCLDAQHGEDFSKLTLNFRDLTYKENIILLGNKPNTEEQVYYVRSSATQPKVTFTTSKAPASVAEDQKKQDIQIAPEKVKDMVAPSDIKDTAGAVVTPKKDDVIIIKTQVLAVKLDAQNHITELVVDAAPYLCDSTGVAKSAPIDKLTEEITFRLLVPDGISGDIIKVVHKHGDSTAFATYFPKVQLQNGQRFVEIKTKYFSSFTLTKATQDEIDKNSGGTGTSSNPKPDGGTSSGGSASKPSDTISSENSGKAPDSSVSQGTTVGKTDASNTGDDGNLLFPLLMMLASAVVILFIIILLLKEKIKNKQ